MGRVDFPFFIFSVREFEEDVEEDVEEEEEEGLGCLVIPDMVESLALVLKELIRF